MTDALVDDWDPRREGDKLKALARVATAMLDGRPAFNARLHELAGGYPTGHRGGGEDADASGQLAVIEDVADREQREFERELAASLDAAARAWARYTRVVVPRHGVEKLAEPGCELCAEVPDHWCPVYGVRVIVSDPKTKRAPRPEIRTLRLCEWCFQMTWPSRMSRLPVLEEVTAHAEGRRVHWRGGAEPKLVEAPCPDCHDESRKARRACKTCGHSGKVLKAAAKKDA